LYEGGEEKKVRGEKEPGHTDPPHVKGTKKKMRDVYLIRHKEREKGEELWPETEEENPSSLSCLFRQILRGGETRTKES